MSDTHFGHARMIAPRVNAHEVTVAEEQPEYLPITVALFAHDDNTHSIVTRWTFNDVQRAAIAAGADVFVTQLRSEGMTPMMCDVGPATWMTGERPASDAT